MYCSFSKLVLFFYLTLLMFLLGCANSLEKDTVEDNITKPQPSIDGFHIFASDNPLQIIEDIKCDIVNDSIIQCWTPYYLEDKYLTVKISWKGDSLFVDNEYLSGNAIKHDFSRPVELLVKTNGFNSKRYTVFIHSFTGLPVLWIETDDRLPVISKEEYRDASLKLVENVTTKSAGEIFQTAVKIKGRGNNTWELPPKKPYRLKFENKVSLLGEPADKSWVLLANYYDKTMIRSTAAFYLGYISRLNYTPKYHFVELFLNGRYDGTYQLIDKIEISKNRLNIGDNGYLIECDRYAEEETDSRYFKLNSLTFPLNIKDPEMDYNDEGFNYVKTFFEETEKALFAESFTDPLSGWRKYIDSESLVDWYIINEICKSCEHLYLLCYFNLQVGGKLKFGPLWDYDKCFGNYTREFGPYHGCELPEGFWVKNSEWFSRLFEDKSFTELVKARFSYFYNKREELYSVINEYATYLKHSAIENNNRWNVLYKVNPYDPQDSDIWGNYLNEVQSLKNWISIRMEWLNVEISQL